MEINRRDLLKGSAAILALGSLSVPSYARDHDPLPSWNDGPAKKAILDFVKTTTDKNSPKFVPPAERIAEFDQDGTLWVEHPIYTQIVYCLDRVGPLVQEKPEFKDREPFKTVLSGNREAIAHLSMRDIFEIVLATQSGMTVEGFRNDARQWLAKAKDPRWKRPFTDLTYLPMQEVLKYLRANGYKTFIATGGSAGFVRVYSEQVYGIPPSRWPAPRKRLRTATTRTSSPSSPGSPSSCSITSKRERSRTFGCVTGAGHMRRLVIPPPTTSRCWST